MKILSQEDQTISVKVFSMLAPLIALPAVLLAGVIVPVIAYGGQYRSQGTLLLKRFSTS